MDTKGLAYAAAMNLVDQYIDACRLHQAGAITTDELTARQRNLRIMGMTIHTLQGIRECFANIAAGGTIGERVLPRLKNEAIREMLHKREH